MLEQRSIFIAEDEAYIALDLAFAVEDAGGRVVGPAASVAEALALLETELVHGAILDVNLIDRDIAPVVALLAERGVPMVLQSGKGLPSELAARFPDLTVHFKPCTSERLIGELAVMLGTRDVCQSRGNGAAA